MTRTDAVGRMAGTVVVVTGAGAGIGAETGRLLAAEGAAVVVADIDDGAGASTVAAIEQAGGEASFQHLDVGDAASFASALERTVDRWGRIDVLVNNAGVGMKRMPLIELPDAEWERQLRLNLTSVYLGCKHGAPHIDRTGGGAIVNIASLSAVIARPGFAAYAAAKAGVIMLTRVLAKELAPSIRVNCVSPVSTDTGMLPTLAPVGQTLESFKHQMQSGIPLGRLNQPADVAAAVLYLASADAAMVTGHNLVVDGGTS